MGKHSSSDEWILVKPVVWPWDVQPRAQIHHHPTKPFTDEGTMRLFETMKENRSGISKRNR